MNAMQQENAQSIDPYASQWPELKLTLDWNSAFVLFFVFTKTQQDAQRLFTHVNAYFEDQGRALTRIEPSLLSGDAKTAYAMNRLFGLNPEGKQPSGLVLDAEALSERDRSSVLTTLNKRRTQLETALNQPVFLALPLACAPKIVEWAPDLWTVRELIFMPADT